MISGIQSTLASFGAAGAKPQNQALGTANFEALLFGVKAEANISRKSDVFGADSVDAGGLIDEFLASIGNPLNGIFSAMPSQPPAFALSSAFEATFGSSGPLPDFIDAMTKKLGLTAQQNLAFQTIAVNNKDITKTPENVQKIAAELRQAGITA